MAVKKKKTVKKATKAVKKKAVKKTVKKAAKAAAPVKKAVKKPAVIKEKYTKTQILNEIAETTDLKKTEVSAVIDSLTDIIERHVKKRGVGEFTLPGLLKISTVRKPATKARKGTNPFTGEETIFKAKPARTVVKVRPLKKLKEMVM